MRDKKARPPFGPHLVQQGDHSLSGGRIYRIGRFVEKNQTRLQAQSGNQLCSHLESCRQGGDTLVRVFSKIQAIHPIIFQIIIIINFEQPLPKLQVLAKGDLSIQAKFVGQQKNFSIGGDVMNIDLDFSMRRFQNSIEKLQQRGFSSSVVP